LRTTIKLLVAAWPELANIPINLDDSDDPDDPDESNTVCNVIQSKGLVELQRTSAYAPPASPAPPHCATELPAQARHACAAVL
jgi:hypothetical protein